MLSLACSETTTILSFNHKKMYASHRDSKRAASAPTWKKMEKIYM